MSNRSSNSSSRKKDDDPDCSTTSAMPVPFSLERLVACATDSGKLPRLGGGANANADPAQKSSLCSITCRQGFCVAVLSYVNLINYMDRFTIAGVLEDVQHAFKIDNDEAGLLQTAFIVSYMVFAPLFGYLGDRFFRRWLMIAGVFVWSGTTLLGSFANSYGMFIACRAAVGLGEASYSTIAPTLISDLFVYNLRSHMLAIFFFAIPVGSGLGYVIGSKAANAAGDWRWSLRVTPILGFIAIILIYLIKEPQRGESEGSSRLKATSYCMDIKHLIRNFSFLLSTAAFTCVAFMTGALSWWGPIFIHLGLKVQSGNENVELNSVAFVFGCITMVAGLLGVPLGVVLSTLLKKRYPAIDPIICGIGVLVSVPMLTAACLLVSKNTIITYILIFFGQLTLNLNWAVNSDILLYIVMPARRSTAEAVQILIAHTLGDAFSPYIVGAISIAARRNRSSPNTRDLAQDALENKLHLFSEIVKSAPAYPLSPRSGHMDDYGSFKSLQHALYCPLCVELLGGIFFLFTAYFVVGDRRRADQETLEANKL